jgi:DNA-directed RNA polymerase subunit RPC12/RpoP
LISFYRLRKLNLKIDSLEYHLNWNDYKSSFSEMIQGICLKEEMTDCTISNGKKSFALHRMILATCSTYLRSLFHSIPYEDHPVILVNDMKDEIIEMLIGYMYSGQVSVTQDEIVPLLSAAKSLGIKGLLDVPLPNSDSEKSPPRQSSSTRPGPPPLKKLKQNPVHSSQQQQHLQQKPCDTKLSRSLKREKYVVSDNDLDMIIDDSVEGVDPLDNDDLTDHELLSQLTDEMTAYSLVPDTSPPGGLNKSLAAGGIILAEPKRVQMKNGAGENPYQMVLYSCSHCGKEFTSKRKHQRHVLNVHFRYNPVQCPFCQKGHRDNYNLKQHVCPVINMKYGVYKSSGGLMEPSIDTSPIKQEDLAQIQTAE